MSDHDETLHQVGRDLGSLVSLARDSNDPKLLLLGEEIERMTADNAKAVLMAAIIIPGDKATIP